jgi:predicted enzyme related to lactoylglutathione lyase
MSQTSSHTNSQAHSPAIHHAITWFEIPVSDLDRSAAFYERLLGITLRRENFGGSLLAVFPASDNGAKGCLMKVDAAPATRDGVIVYLNAGPALNPVLERLAACGGQLLTPRVDLPPGMGCFAHIADPDGQRIGLHALD